MQPTSSPRSPMTDSPWFWVYLFGTGALIALTLAAPKFGNRQAQQERRQQGREMASGVTTSSQAQADGAEEKAAADEDAAHVTLRPLFAAMAVASVVGWIVFWTQRRRQWAAASAMQLNAANPPTTGAP